MKLLLDENLAPRLAASLQPSFPESGHVSKDWDFQQLSFVRGAPPKVVWLRRGNCSARELEELLQSHVEVIRAFGEDLEAAVLVLG